MEKFRIYLINLEEKLQNLEYSILEFRGNLNALLPRRLIFSGGLS